MDLTNFSEGTILDNIIRINEEMAKKLKLKVDLRTDNLLENTEATKTDL
jgi:predicted nucleotidyltransferase